MKTSQLPSYLSANKIPFEIQPWQMAYRLAHLREGMAVPPSQLPGRLLKEFAVELATPPAYTYNRSLREGHVPLIWRQATITLT